MITWPDLLVIVNLIIIIGGVIGGYIVIRSAIAKSETDVQTRVRDALHDENELLRGRIQRLESENKRQAKALETIITTLKKVLNIELDIDEDVITLRYPNGNVSRVSTDAD